MVGENGEEVYSHGAGEGNQSGVPRDRARARSAIRQDLPYLRLIFKEAVRLHPRRPPEEHVMLANLREYLMWLTIDALEDEVMAKELIHSFTTLEDELNVIKVDRRNRRLDPSAPAFYEAFIQALRLSLSYYHRVSLDLEEFYNREKFLKAWTWTQKILGFDCGDAGIKVERTSASPEG